LLHIFLRNSVFGKYSIFSAKLSDLSVISRTISEQGNVNKNDVMFGDLYNILKLVHILALLINCDVFFLFRIIYFLGLLNMNQTFTPIIVRKLRYNFISLSYIALICLVFLCFLVSLSIPPFLCSSIFFSFPFS
jgi:hypothetical protein